MSFIKSLKSAFGFSDAESQEAELEGIDATVIPLKARVDSHPENSDVDAHENLNPTILDSADNSVETDEDSDALPATQAIFETVVKVFNDSMPEFLKQSLNEKSQCEYLYNQLNESLKLYLEQVATDARRRVSDRWEAERKHLQAQMSTLRTKLQKDEEESSEIKRQQLSAERQKRALGDRVRDLEAQLQKAEAEMEQLSLENKSMANKLRVNAVLSTSEGETEAEAVEAMAKQIEELTLAVESAKIESDDAKNAKANAETELERLKSELVKAEQINAEQTAKIENLEKGLAESRVKDDVGDAMLTDLHSKLAAAKEALEAAETRCAALQAEKDTLSEEYDQQQQELTVALENLAEVETMQEQLAQLVEARKNNEEYIKKKKEELHKSEERIQQLIAENGDLKHEIDVKESTLRHLEDIADSLRKTIERNLYEHAQTQNALREEINRLKAQNDTNDASLGGELGSGLSGADVLTDKSPESKDSRNFTRRKKVTISAIDESIEDTDWLVSTPPENVKKDPEEEDFGYKAPQKKMPADNPDQMLLF